MELLSGVLIGLGFIASFIAGMFSKGININVNKDPFNEEGEYNESPPIQDPEIKEYFDQNHGNIKF